MGFELNDEVKHALNTFTPEEISRKISYPFEHEILWYGIDGVAHAHLMRKAKELGAEQFVAKYVLNREMNSSASVPVCLDTTIENDGIFIPRARHYDLHTGKFDQDTAVPLFFVDYRGKFNRSDLWWLTERGKKWKVEDFANPEILRQGVEFGIDLWNASVKRFEKYLPDYPQQLQRVTDLARKLIEYYNLVVEG